jgi:hypothetical protein
VASALEIVVGPARVLSGPVKTAATIRRHRRRVSSIRESRFDSRNRSGRSTLARGTQRKGFRVGITEPSEDQGDHRIVGRAGIGKALIRSIFRVRPPRDDRRAIPDAHACVHKIAAD